MSNSIIGERVHVNWLDDSSGVLHTCHINGPGDRKSTYVGEVCCVFDEKAKKHKWFSKLKGQQGSTEHCCFNDAKSFVESSVGGRTVDNS